MNFWEPDPENPRDIVRTARTEDYACKISEFPHLIVNQARVLDYFAEAAAQRPRRASCPTTASSSSASRSHDDGRVPRRGARAPHRGRARGRGAHRAREVRRRLRRRAQRRARGDRRAARRRRIRRTRGASWTCSSNTDFPDWRTKCAINVRGGQHPAHPARGRLPLPHVRRPRRGRRRTTTTAVRQTPLDEIIRKANDILHPYSLDVKEVAWHSVYEVGHRVTDSSTTCPGRGRTRTPRVFLTGDACHTHSAKAGQGMNVSMQDGFNLGWKLGQVLDGRSPESLLATYSAERQPVAQHLIDFDREWSTLMARKPEEISRPVRTLADFYLVDRRVPVGVHDAVRAVDDRRRMPRTRQLATGLPARQALQVRRGRARRATATPCTSVTTRRPTGAGASTPSPTRRPRASASALADVGGVAGDSPESPVARLHAGRRRPRRRASTSRSSTSSATSDVDISRRVPALFLPADRAARADGLGEGLRRRP